jgi:hypothetical protein
MLRCLSRMDSYHADEVLVQPGVVPVRATASGGVQLGPRLQRMVGMSIDGRSIVFRQCRTATADIGRLPGTQISLLPTEELVEGFDLRGPYDITLTPPGL